jgi:hypothetical protein
MKLMFRRINGEYRAYSFSLLVAPFVPNRLEISIINSSVLTCVTKNKNVMKVLPSSSCVIR